MRVQQVSLRRRARTVVVEVRCDDRVEVHVGDSAQMLALVGRLVAGHGLAAAGPDRWVAAIGDDPARTAAPAPSVTD